VDILGILGPELENMQNNSKYEEGNTNKHTYTKPDIKANYDPLLDSLILDGWWEYG